MAIQIPATNCGGYLYLEKVGISKVLLRAQYSGNNQSEDAIVPIWRLRIAVAQIKLGNSQVKFKNGPLLAVDFLPREFCLYNKLNPEERIRLWWKVSARGSDLILVRTKDLLRALSNKSKN